MLGLCKKCIHCEAIEVPNNSYRTVLCDLEHEYVIPKRKCRYFVTDNEIEEVRLLKAALKGLEKDDGKEFDG